MSLQAEIDGLANIKLGYDKVKTELEKARREQAAK
jgi:hypothetical protein